MASMQPAPPTGGELIPSPEPMDESDPYMPYGGGGESFDEMLDEGNVYGNYAMPGRKYAFLAGGEGLLLRPHWSQATAMTETTTTQSGSHHDLRREPDQLQSRLSRGVSHLLGHSQLCLRRRNSFYVLEFQLGREPRGHGHVQHERVRLFVQYDA